MIDVRHRGVHRAATIRPAVDPTATPEGTNNPKIRHNCA
jgi:hypothetical protein